MVWRLRTEIGRRIKHFIRADETVPPPRGTRQFQGQEENGWTKESVEHIDFTIPYGRIEIDFTKGSDVIYANVTAFEATTPGIIEWINYDGGDVSIRFVRPATVIYDDVEEKLYFE